MFPTLEQRGFCRNDKLCRLLSLGLVVIETFKAKGVAECGKETNTSRGCRDFKKRPRVDFFGNERWAEPPNVIRHVSTLGNNYII